MRTQDDKRIPILATVSQTKQGTYIPPTIPIERSSLRYWLTSILIGGIFLGGLICSWISEDIGCWCAVALNLEATNYGILTLVIVEVLHRLILLAEEFLRHFTSRYEKSYIKLGKYVFETSKASLCLLFVSVIIFICFYMRHGWIDGSKLNIGTYLMIVSIVLLLKKNANFEDSPIYRALRLEENNGLNYGAGMAYSFFHGYVKLIGEKSGREDENLKEKIQNYSDSQGVKFLVAKLFILIPKSCICHVSLKDDKFPNIEESSSLGEMIQTVAGVQNRVYKNSVYKIYDEKKKERVYVCVEYATPLRTFKLGLDSNGPHAKYFEDHVNDIALQFYSTLKMLIEKHPEMADICELIYYDDKDENGDFIDVGKVILARVKKLTKKTQ